MTNTGQKTVYFLGAGASAASDFHLPTMKEFFKDSNFTTAEYQNLKQFIENKFPGLPVEKLNLEEVVTTIDLSIDTFGSLGEYPEPFIHKARRELDKYINTRLGVVNASCSLLGKIFDKNEEWALTDSIITLNYDLVIERCISVRMYQIPGPGNWLSQMDSLLCHTTDSDPRQNFSLPYTQAYSPLLKLHGSIDWFYCPNPGCVYHQQFFPNRINSIFSTPVRSGDLCRICGSPIVTAIVPPTMYKTFEKFPKMGLIWSLAYRELNTADRIVIFGVSFAPSDYYLRWLFKKAITDRDPRNRPIVFDIDVKSDVCEKVKEITGIAPQYFPTLDEYLAKQ